MRYLVFTSIYATVVFHSLAAAAQSSIDVRVSSSAEDAEERESGNVVRDSSDLEMIFDRSLHQIVGIRFSGVDIPQGALVTDAYIQFTVDEATSESTGLLIQAQDADDAPAFSSSDDDISDRLLTDASVGWEPPPWTEVDDAGDDQRTPNLAAIVQEVVDRPGWQPGNDMAFIVTGTTGSRVAESFDGTEDEAPLLHVEFTDQIDDTEPPTVALTEPAPGEVSGNVTLTAEASDNIGVAGVTFELDGTPLGDPDTQEPYRFTWDTTAELDGSYSLTATATDFAGNSTTSDPAAVDVANAAPPPGQSSSIDVRVSSSANDAEERESGSMSRTSSDLEMIFDRSLHQIVGIRFSPVNIPQGALITDAYIQFTVDETTSGSTVLAIQAQDADHAPAFGSGTNDISDRQLTAASVGWEPPPWTDVDVTGDDQRTPNLAAIVQEVVDRPGWQPGNGMAFIVTGTTGSRVAESFDGTEDEAPLLHVEFAGQVDDTEPPTVALTAPAPGEVSGNVSLTAEASDNIGIASVTFELDGNPLDGPDTQEPYSFVWDTTTDLDGSYSLTATATDSAGNSTTSDPVVVEVANAAPPPPPPPTGTVRVPEDEPTIQDGVDAASDGDTVLVAAGIYNERVIVADKSVRIECVNNDTTVIDPESSSGEAVTFESSASGSALVNCKVRGTSHAIVLDGDNISILGNRVEDADTDAISIERSAENLIQGNTIINAGDDCVDVDHPTGDALIKSNICIDPSGDGVEIRNSHNDDPPALVEIEGNEFVGAGEDGIQLIDYDGISNRTFVITRNLIRDSSDAGIGFMSDGETREDFRAASVPEPVDIFNNTLSGNRYGITASGNVIILNNIIAGSTTLGFKGEPEVVAYTLFHGNATDYESSQVDPNTAFTGDPEFDADFRLGAGSAAIDAGTAQFVHNGSVVLDIPPSEYNGAAPDLGAFEF